MQWEFQKTPGSVIHLFSAAYAIAITFSIVTCWRLEINLPHTHFFFFLSVEVFADVCVPSRLDNVRTKVWVALCGVFSTALAVLSGFGALLLLGRPFVMTAASCPFMILGGKVSPSRSKDSSEERPPTHLWFVQVLAWTTCSS